MRGFESHRARHVTRAVGGDLKVGGAGRIELHVEGLDLQHAYRDAPHSSARHARTSAGRLLRSKRIGFLRLVPRRSATVERFVECRVGRSKAEFAERSVGGERRWRRLVGVL